MENGFVILTPRMPAYKGAPCTGCGACCQDGPCEIAVELIGAPERTACQALEWDGKRHLCGMMLHPHKYIPDFESKGWADEVLIPLIRLRLGEGRGCYAMSHQLIPC